MISPNNHHDQIIPNSILMIRKTRSLVTMMTLVALHSILFLAVVSLARGQGAATQKFIVDLDAGADDGVALALLLGSEALGGSSQVIGITTVNGNTGVENVIVNVLKVLDTANRTDIPLYRGVNSSLTINLPSDNYFGKDGFGDFEYPNPPNPDDYVQDEHAVTYLIRTFNENQGGINLICLGPLTNIALAVRLDSKFLSKVGEIVVLGGSISGRGNVKPGVEFNVYQDAEAWQIVLSKAEEIGKRIKLVPIETTQQAYISGEWRKKVLGTLGTPIIELLNKAESKVLNESQWQFTDSIAAAVATQPNLTYNLTSSYIAVETCGQHTRGFTVVDYNGISNKADNVLIVEGIDVEQMKELLIKTLGQESLIRKGD